MNAKRIITLLLALVMMFALVACGAPSTAPAETKTETPAQPETTDVAVEEDTMSDKYLVWNLGGEPKTWDPQLNTASTGGHVILNLYDGLVRDTIDGVKMATAEKVELSENAEGVADTVYTFTLRDDAVWSDGQKVTAYDYEFAWRRACSPELASPYAFLVTDYIKGAYEYFSGTGTREEVCVTAVDEKTLVVELKQPTAYFLNLVSFFTYMPAREDLVAGGEGWEKDVTKCITNGAFTLEEYAVGSHLLLKKNENFWNADNVQLAGIKALFITDPTTSLQGYEAGEINVTSTLPGEEIPRLLAEDPNFTSDPALGCSYFQFNMDADVVNNLNVRKALTLAVDRKLIVEQIMRNGALPANAFVAPTFALSTGESLRAFDDNGNLVEEFDIDPYAAKVEEAQQLLADAGYPNGEGFPELTVLYYESGNNAVVAEAVQQMWQDNLGIKVKLQGQEYAVFANLVNTNDWSVAFTGWSADYNDPMTMLALFTANGLNECRWRYKAYEGVPDDVTLNPEQEAYDIAVNKAAVTSGEERDSYLMEAEKILMENYVICPINFTTYTQVIDFTRVSGPGRTPIGQWDFQYYTVIE